MGNTGHEKHNVYHTFTSERTQLRPRKRPPPFPDLKESILSPGGTAELAPGYYQSFATQTPDSRDNKKRPRE